MPIHAHLTPLAPIFRHVALGSKHLSPILLAVPNTQGGGRELPNLGWLLTAFACNVHCVVVRLFFALIYIMFVCFQALCRGCKAACLLFSIRCQKQREKLTFVLKQDGNCFDLQNNKLICNRIPIKYRMQNRRIKNSQLSMSNDVNFGGVTLNIRCFISNKLKKKELARIVYSLCMQLYCIRCTKLFEKQVAR